MSLPSDMHLERGDRVSFESRYGDHKIIEGHAIGKEKNVHGERFTGVRVKNLVTHWLMDKEIGAVSRNGVRIV